jgi:hypothetical protein
MTAQRGALGGETLGAPVDREALTGLRPGAPIHPVNVADLVVEREDRNPVCRLGVVAWPIDRHPAIVHRVDVELGCDRFEIRPRQGYPPAHGNTLAAVTGVENKVS